jgi:hypothetical protein
MKERKMKTVKTAEDFKPVSIVLESQKEVDWMYDLTGSVSGVGKVRDFVDSIYYGLEELYKEETDLFTICEIKEEKQP